MKDRGVRAYGTVSTRALFSKFPDAENLQRQLVLKITEVVDGDVAHADKQTRDTREIFSIPDAVGILVLLNEHAQMLSPDMIHYALTQALQKKKPDGSLRYPHNDAVMLISESHPIDMPGVRKAFPILNFIALDTPSRHAPADALEMLQTRWARFNGVPLIRASVPPHLK